MIAAAVIQTSCGKKDAAKGGAGTLKFTINGTNYSYNVPDGAIVALGTTTISGVASGSNPNSFNLQMQGTGSNTYTIGATTNGLIMQYLVNATTDLYETPAHGNINFTISGATANATFSGVLYGSTATDSIIVTNGSYSGGYNPE